MGHCGAPTRLGYTALGDGVNLAARLEPLCKQYGVVCLASEAVVKDARHAFDFRRIDVYELLGPKGCGHPRAETYERAFERYLARDFDGAALLEAQAADPPSVVLRDRCRALAEEPPPAAWTGVHVSKSK